MIIDDVLISKLEKLSMLSLSEQEREIIKNDLSEILNMIDKMNEMNTENVEPLTHLLHEKYLRNDEVEESLPIEKVFSNTSASLNNHFTVPKILNK